MGGGLKKVRKAVTIAPTGSNPTYPSTGQGDKFRMDAAVTTGMERRRFRRAELDMTVAIRPEASDSPSPITGWVRNVSLAGVYAYVKPPFAPKPGDQVFCEVSVPSEQTRVFPFTRIISKGWIVRVDQLSAGRREHDIHAQQQLGVAVAFTKDVKAFGTV